jgi:hypothetical protein
MTHRQRQMRRSRRRRAPFARRLSLGFAVMGALAALAVLVTALSVRTFGAYQKSV